MQTGAETAPIREPEFDVAEAMRQSEMVVDRDEDFLGSGWSFIESVSGNYWYHRASGKKLMSSSTWAVTWGG